MKKHCHHHYLSRIAAVLLTLLVTIFYALPIKAQSLSENFVITFEPVVYDRSQAAPGEVFNAIFKGHAECNKSLPLPVSEANITLQIVAKNVASGNEIILNPSLIITVKPFPDKAGETYDVNETIPLQFPADTVQGDYHVTAKFLEAKGKVILIWTDFSGYLPSEQDMGTIKCALPGTGSTTVSGTSTTKPSITIQTSPSTTPANTPAIKSTTPSASPLLPPASKGQKSSLIVWIVVFVLVAIIIILVIMLLVRRRD